MQSLRKALGLSALLSLGTAVAAEEGPVPTVSEEFLEYLASWDGDDADWLVVTRADAVDPDRVPPAAERRGHGDESPPADTDDANAQE